MITKVRVNLANPLELRGVPGLTSEQADAIVRYRVEHGPIQDATQLARIVDARVGDDVLEWLDFSPSDATAPEAPGA
ncbi:MAG TPA: helix-hairpin-helix domain-containing protein [Methylomirabilota bacterium]|nr:helix-hairpin-helix domain-containing protein [Methylomirabilota bacterium]